MAIQKIKRAATPLAAVAAALSLAGCLGGGGDAAPNSTTPTPGGGGAGDTGGSALATVVCKASDTCLRGTVSVGSVLDNVSMFVVDANNKVAQVFPNASGKFEVSVNDFAFPVVAQACGDVIGTGRSRNCFYSVAKRAGYINVNPLTTSVLELAAKADPALNGSAATVWQSNLLPSDSRIQAAQAALVNVLSPAFQAASVETSGLDFFTTPYAADHNGLDKVMDYLKFFQLNGDVQIANVSYLPRMIGPSSALFGVLSNSLLPLNTLDSNGAISTVTLRSDLSLVPTGGNQPIDPSTNPLGIEARHFSIDVSGIDEVARILAQCTPASSATCYNTIMTAGIIDTTSGQSFGAFFTGDETSLPIARLASKIAVDASQAPAAKGLHANIFGFRMINGTPYAAASFEQINGGPSFGYMPTFTKVIMRFDSSSGKWKIWGEHWPADNLL